MRRRIRSAAWLAACVALLAPGCYQRSEKLPQVDEGARPAADARPALDLCVVPVLPPRDSVLRYSPVADRLTQSTSRRVVLRPAATGRLALERLRSGEADLAILGPVAAARARLGFGAVELARIDDGLGTAYHGTIVVRYEDAARELRDLRGRRLGLVDPESTTGQLLPLAGFAEAGLAPRDLGAILYLDRHELVARAVLRGEVDAGAVRRTVADRYTRRGLRVLWTSPPTPGPIVVAGPRLPEEIRDEIRRVLLESAIAPGGIPVDSSIRLRFAAIRDEDRAVVTALMIRVYGESAFTGDLRVSGAEGR
jgi:phosphonate transport system substrate-binding protein